MKPDTNAVCPHCALNVRLAQANLNHTPASGFEVQATTSQDALRISQASCPNCGNVSLTLVARWNGAMFTAVKRLIWPIGSARPVPPEVVAEDADLASDMEEAAAVLPISPKASAALSRRALQHMLIEKARVKKSANLVAQIKQAIPDMPATLGENVDEIRKIGNYAAHPKKSDHTGEILPVEEGEADYTLEVLWDLADHYYTKPARYRETREKFAAKKGTAEGAAGAEAD